MYKKGDPKWGKLKRKTVTWRTGKRGPIGWEQVPSYLISQFKGVQPVQIQNLIGYLTGEIEAFDAIARSVGLHTATTYGEEKKSEVKKVVVRKKMKPMKRVKVVRRIR